MQQPILSEVRDFKGETYVYVNQKIHRRNAMKQINKVAVLGAGVMGATIAAQLANAGIRTLLLDIVPQELKADTSSPLRNKIAEAGVAGLLKMKPAPLFLPGYASYIEVGNFDDDMARLKECDWVIEVVIENMPIKKQLLTEKIVPNLKEGAILSTNTSGLSVNEICLLYTSDAA